MRRAPPENRDARAGGTGIGNGFINQITWPDLVTAPRSVIQDEAQEAQARELAQIEMAAHVAHLGGRHVLEALRAAQRGQAVVAVLEDYRRLPRWRGLQVRAVSP